VTRIGQHYGRVEPEISYCIVNTNGRDLLLRCLESIFRHPTEAASFEVLVLDNASDDGSAGAARDRYGERITLIERDRRRGKPENDSLLVERSRGQYCLLLNEDSELTAGAVDALLGALADHPGAAAAGARLLSPAGVPQPSAWRFPGVATGFAGALFLHRRFTVQSRGDTTRRVDWVQSAGMLIRRDAWDEVGPMDPAFFVYSDEVDWQRRARDAGWSVVHVPSAQIVHHEQLAHGASGQRRIVEFARNRDRFVRKHGGPLRALLVRVLTAWAYALRALTAAFLPGHSPRRYLAHAYYSLLPSRGEGLREAADAYNLRAIAREEGHR
jgi:N-acetylglucosaminyl-diphospho-decaprenol L-rhamnosyltransferase